MRHSNLGFKPESPLNIIKKKGMSSLKERDLCSLFNHSYFLSPAFPYSYAVILQVFPLLFNATLDFFIIPHFLFSFL